MNSWLSLRGDDLDHIEVAAYGGVGLIKSEAIAKETGLYVTHHRRLDMIAAYVSHVCDIFAGKPVWYRFSCHSSLTANSMVGNRHFIEEHTPFLGCYGTRRIQQFEDEFIIEASMVVELQRKHANIGVILPFIHEPAQYRWAVQAFKREHYCGPIGIMVEIPSSVLLLHDFIEEGCASFLIGLNDLTSLTLGVARYQDSVSEWYSRHHPAVVRLVQMAVRQAHSRGIQIGVAGYLDEHDLEVYDKIEVDYASLYKPAKLP